MNRRNMDLMILAVVALLLVIGVLMVFSASFVKAEQERLDRYYFLKRQAAFAMIGVAAMFAVAQVQYWHWRRLAVPALYITLALLVLVTIPSIGTLVSGARRWLGYGAFSFQPSELAKVTLLIFWAAYFAVRQEQVRKFWPILPVFGGVLGLVFALVMRQPDLGTAVAIAGTSLTMLFVAGARLGPMIMLGMASLPALAYLIFSEEYRARRIFAFLWPERDPLGAGYHIIQSLYALGSGQLFGVGYGASRQKFYYLPEQHTDFIFSILGEELGFIGASMILVLFLVFAWRGFRIAVAAPDTFACLLATGVTTMIILQAIVNIGVVTASLPITGIPLPFLSYGGSSLLFTLAGVGILLNLSKYVRQ